MSYLISSQVASSFVPSFADFCGGVWSLSHVHLFATPWTAACQPSLSSTVSHSLLRLVSVESAGNAIQPSHPLSSTSPPAFNLSQCQGLFQWVGSSHQIGQSIGASTLASVLPINIQGWFPSGWTGVISLMSKELSRVLCLLLGFLVSKASSHYYLTLSSCIANYSMLSLWPVMCGGDTITPRSWHASGLQDTGLGHEEGLLAKKAGGHMGAVCLQEKVVHPGCLGWWEVWLSTCTAVVLFSLGCCN